MNDLIYTTGFKLIFIPVIYGLAEAWASQGNRTVSGTKFIFGQFGFYHAVMLLFFITINGTLGHAEFTPLTILIEDLFFFVGKFFYTGRWKLTSKSWVNWKFGGIGIGRIWIPHTYFILIGIYAGIRCVMAWLP